MQSYIRYKNYCDKKTKTSPMQKKFTATNYNLKRTTKDQQIPFRGFRWIAPHVVKKSATQRIIHILQNEH